MFVVLCVLVVGGLGIPATAAPTGEDGRLRPDRVDPGLLADLEAGATDRFVVELTGTADVTAAARGRSGDAQGRAVVESLQRTHDRTAPAVVAEVTRAGARARGYWLTNAVVVDDGDTALARRLAARDDVAAVRAEKVYPLVQPVETAVVEVAEAAAEWGVAKIGADQAWTDGVLGSGIVVANIDTGVEYLHEALVEQYRGNNHDGTFTHDYNWWDPSGICGVVPCDNAEHGTHTMGTIVGGDGPGPFTPDIGVAPGAQWIAAKGCEDLFCSEGALLSSGQFVLAPTTVTGQGPDPTKRPDIVNNSWGGGAGDPFYDEVVTAWRAAGIVPVFSSGNPGPGCGDGGSPGDHLAALSVGATDIDDVIAPFSGRGPSPFGKVNPDVTAPGVDVLSSVPGGYAEFSGTSMAAPHTAGTLALMLSAEPSLIHDVDGAIAALKDTAVDILDGQCGGDSDLDPNNVYGDGRIDAAAAVALVATGGTLAGTITDDTTSGSIGGARVTALSAETGRAFTATAASDGTYSLFLAAGNYAVTASYFAYADSQQEATIETDLVTVADFSLVPLPRYDVTGVVSQAEDGAPVAGAAVTALGTPLDPAVTDAAGAYALSLPSGTWTLRARAGGCTDTVDVEVVVADAPASQDVQLARKLDDFGHTCRAIPLAWVDAATETPLFGDDTAGRFTLPFVFDHYGVGHSAVYVTSNGYLTFLPADVTDPFPVTPPRSDPPNASVYALWQDLVIDETGSVHVDVVGDAPDRAFVVEWRDVLVSGSTSRVDLEVKLWENGAIDVLYGSNPAVADGRRAVIGLEDATGTDAFVFSAFESSVAPSSAYRYEVADVARITGTVTDANDALPVAGATITAAPGLRSTTTASDGTYSLSVLPGSYDVAIAATGYVTQVTPLVLAADEDVVLDAVLDAPVATVAPSEIEVTHPVGSVTNRTVTVGNDGTAPLTWELRERRAPAPPSEPAPLAEPTGGKRAPGWGWSDGAPSPARVSPTVIPQDDLEVIIDDPVGDAVGVDVDDVLAASDGSEVAFLLRAASESSANNLSGYVFLDLDQDEGTGVPPDEWAGLPDQDVGVDLVVDLFGVGFEGLVYVFDPMTFDFLGSAPATVAGTDVSFALPLEMLYGDDGTMDVAAVVGDFSQPTDWLPDVGHGTLEPFTDLPWMTPSVTSGVIAPGDSTEVTVAIGLASLQPGAYAGSLVLASDAPRASRLTVPVDLTVPLPPSWGEVTGTVVDARTLDPLDAEVVLSATWLGGAYPITTTAEFGKFQFHAPGGTWPIAATRAGYLPATDTVDVVAGSSTDVLLALAPVTPQASIDVDGVEVLLEAGGSTSSTITLRNDGPVALHFDSGEVDLGVSDGGDGPGVGVAEIGTARTDVTRPEGDATTLRSTRTLGRSSPVAGVQAVGDVVTSWPTGLAHTWGAGFDGDVLVGDPDQGLDARFTVAGDLLATFETPWAGEWAADMAHDPGRDLVWQVNVGGNNGIYGLDPHSGAVEHVITGSPWADISQRGLAYDPDGDVFYIGGWNEGIVYRVAGLSWPTPGATLGQCFPDDPNISGLAYNRAFGALWMTTNSESDTIWLLDADTCGAGYTLPFPAEGGFWGAGVELDVAGNLWVASQTGEMYLVESGLPLFTDVPWLSASPVSGTVAAGGSSTITLTVDAAGLPLGVHQALFVLITDDPLASAVPVPVTLTVAKDVPGDDVITVTTRRHAAEPGTDALVRVTRSEAFGPLTVDLRVAGTATPGEDVEALPTSVTFADGQRTADIPVHVIDDDVPEGAETVTVSVRPRSRYLVGTPDLAVVTIADDEVPLTAGVTRLSGADRYATAAAVSQDGFADGAAAAVVLARGDDFADGLAGGPLAATLGGPLLLTARDALPDATHDELARVLPAGRTVHVLGGPAAIDDAVMAVLADLGYQVERIAGATRFETAVRIAERLGDPALVLVAVGTNFPDALSASAVATALGGVVVFSAESAPHTSTDAYLAANPEVPRYAIGGPAARGYPSIGPIVGADRYLTAIGVAERFLGTPFAVGFARGDAFPDALTGGLHIGLRAGPLLLTPTDSLDPRVSTFLEADDASRWVAGYLYGGEAALSLAVEVAVEGLLP